MRLACVVVVGVLHGAVPVLAQPFPEQSIPDPLKKWVPWALDGTEDRRCPAVGGAAVCLWPGRLQLSVSARGGAFTLGAYADRALDLPLPGGDKRWPQAVLLDGRPAVVLENEGQPVVRLAPGAHKVEGRFFWDRTPDSLAVPPAIALVDLSLEGRAMPLPRREEGGLLLLREGAALGAGGENLQLKAFRKIADGIPIFVETRIVFDVSGKAREVALTGALLAGARPVAVTGDLEARLESDGKLRVQVRAGTFTLRVLALLSGRPDALLVPKAEAPWPEQEVWVFAAAERLRQVEISGAAAIDASRTDLPEEWRQLPAFQLEDGGQLELHETRRGEPAAAPDQVGLSRRLWLDEDGSAFTVRDTFRGRLGRSSRLNALGPAELGRVATGGKGQLITRDLGAEGPAGVELREETLSVEADSRLPLRGPLPAVGWAVNVQTLQADVLLPPGWRLLGTTGVDHAAGSWMSLWDLWALLFVLVTAMGTYKLFGPGWGALSFVTLIVLHGESEAPGLVWLSLLASLAAMNVFPRGVLRKLGALAWALSLLVLICQAAPFVVRQIRAGLFPQITEGRDAVHDELAGALQQPPVARPAPPTTISLSRAATPEGKEPSGFGDAAAGAVVRGRLPGAPPSPKATPPARLEPAANAPAVPSYPKKAYEQDPHAVIQTGAGVPTWTWTSHRLTWSGPVAKDQRMRLVLLSPGVNLLLALLRIALTVLLALRLAAAILGGPRWKHALEAAAVVLMVTVLLSPAPASAQDAPSPQLLQELRERLTRPPACAPHCVATANLRLIALGSELRLEAEVHAGALGAWPIPGPAESWVPRSVSIDGVPAEGQIARLADGFLHLRVAAGTHEVTVVGPLPPQDNLTLQFAEKPRRASALAQGWQVDGIRDDGSADDSVQLSRKVGNAAKGAAGAAGAAAGYEPWLEVTRVLDIGVSWNVETIVRRVSPPGVPVVVKVPILKGMLVTDSERQVKDGEVLVALGRDQMEARWSATLSPAEGATVALEAPEGKPWSEVWVVACGLVWQCEAQGLAPVSRLREGRVTPEFRPWPGESLSLAFRRPKGIEGRSMTLDRVSLRLVPGKRLEDATLDMKVRASRGGPLSLTLPAGAEVRELKVKGVDRPIRTEGNKLTLTIEPGEQPVKVVWRTSGGLGIGYRAPAVDVGGPAVNAHVSVLMPEERWLLYMRGPSWGPAVLFWGTLLFVVFVSIVLSRTPLTPLTTAQWVVLGLGLTQIPLVDGAIVAGWVFVLAWRRDRVLERAALHDLLQIALVAWTLVAMVCLYGVIQQGLSADPDMQVAGGGSTGTQLQWYQDRVDGALPRPWVLSVPLWAYRLTMLAWSLWLALWLRRWLPWSWASFTSGGLWRPLWPPKVDPPVEPPPAKDPPAAG